MHCGLGGLPMIYVDISTQYFDCGELYHPYKKNKVVEYELIKTMKMHVEVQCGQNS